MFGDPSVLAIFQSRLSTLIPGLTVREDSIPAGSSLVKKGEVKWEDSIHADASLTEKKETNDEDINSKTDKNITIRRISVSPFIEQLLRQGIRA
jgi:hypothetical protein